MINIYVTATNTDIGKTYTTLKLIECFSALGYKVGAMKPIETGVKEEPQDATLLLNHVKKVNPLFKDITHTEICPIQFSLPAAPYVAKKRENIDYSHIYTAQQKLSSLCDILLIESAGGLMTPIDEETVMIDLATFFDATILLITDDQLGCINNTLLNIHLLESMQKKYIWCINKKNLDNSFEQISLPYFQAKFDTTLTIQEDCIKIANSLLSLSQELS